MLIWRESLQNGTSPGKWLGSPVINGISGKLPIFSGTSHKHLRLTPRGHTPQKYFPFSVELTHNNMQHSTLFHNGILCDKVQHSQCMRSILLTIS